MDRRRPSASINFITCHDGFTLTDLVSYNEKHNCANGEDDGDGESNNRSWNCGVEGSTTYGAVKKLRARQIRNLMATLMLSQGVPLLSGGDEIGRTQKGNNNAYCQDNELSWMDWEHADHGFFAFVQKLIALRRDHSVFRKRHFCCDSLEWYRHDGAQMTPDDWNTPWAKTVGMFLRGSAADDTDGDFYIAFNAHSEPVEFTIPRPLGYRWRIVLRTVEGRIRPVALSRGIAFCVEAHSLVVIARTR